MIENGVEWPDTVPVLNRRDICRETPEDEKGARCLRMWLETCFEAFPSAKRIAEHAVEDECGNSLISIFNDDPNVSKSRIASVWNRVMAKLGYVVGNSEAKNIKRKRK